MEIRNVRTFIKVAELGNFTKAAGELGYSQSTITMQIKQLEEELQTELFDRNGKLISLSASGREFLPYAYEIVRCEHAALEHFLCMEEPEGTLSIGIMETICSSGYEDLFYRFINRHPKAALNLKIATTFEAEEYLDKGRFDVIFLLDDKVSDPSWVTALEIPADIAFFCAYNHPLAGQRDVPMERILKENFILTEKGCNYRRVFEDDLAAEGKELHCSMEIGHTPFIIDAVAGHSGIGLLPLFTLKKELERGTVSLIHVKDYQIRMLVQVIYHRNRWISPLLKTFLAELNHAGTLL